MHNSPAVSSAKSFDLTSTAFLIVAFLTGIAGALQTPTLSIFLTDEVHARPAMVGFFFTGSAVIGILVSQFLAGRSDKRGDRKSLIVFCCLLGVLACTLFAWNRNYFVLLFVGVFLSSFGSTANPQMFALAREHADKTGREAVMFSSFLRAQVSLAWVIGPPLAYALAMGFSFTVMYLSAAVAFIVCGVMMGTAAGLEIPTMLIAGYFAKRLGKRFLMRVAAVGGVCFYAGMLMAHSPVILLGLQLLNAIFIGILGGIGMLYFQDLMPGQAGSATTLYTNTSRVGWIIAGSVAGIVAEIWNYHAVFWFAMVMIIATLFCLLRIKDV
ncbi:TPA: MFS transporter [Escherichia coli]|uniref:MFS transporter n=1 Tax=Escherichia coli TaxID=562 RepID=UPI001EEF0683|nr:MFS transporter [Escherichia coli]EII2881453.1 MFS transporter [Escherichia coli]HAV7019253.1 MFS transporter [Escherichia coli]HAW0121872.1 MFS transporter [Escherichia coli]HCO7846304.1 MFS transporter [Escherichia coli]HEI3397486.1 MFS transporter [Escherichia coli]